jgi:hypothetical protein
MNVIDVRNAMRSLFTCLLVTVLVFSSYAKKHWPVSWQRTSIWSWERSTTQ